MIPPMTARGIASTLALDREIWLPSPSKINRACIAFEIGNDGCALAIRTAISAAAAVQKNILQSKESKFIMNDGNCERRTFQNVNKATMSHKVLSLVDLVRVSAPSWTFCGGFGAVNAAWIPAVANSRHGVSMSKAEVIVV